jgi:multiple sugar transport system substrate-binding protein
LIEDLTPYVKKFKTDMNRFDPVTIQSLKQFSDQGESVALPYAMNFSAMFYNKDIFDKFGVGYPKDGMSWDDAVALGTRLNRNEAGTQYRGLNPGGADLMGYGLSLNYVDKKTDKAILNTDKWKMVVEKVVQIYKMPGFMDAVPGGQGQPNFMNDRTTAMLTAWGGGMLGPLEELQKKGNPMNWDMATVPTFPEAKGKQLAIDFHMLLAAKTSKHKDQAYQVIKTVSGPEVQKIINRTTRVTVLKKTDEYKKNFGADLTSLKGKNLNAIFGSTPNVLYTLTEYDGKARGYLKEAAYDMARGKFDVNTALRTAEDQTNQYIEDQKKK